MSIAHPSYAAIAAAAPVIEEMESRHHEEVIARAALSTAWPVIVAEIRAELEADRAADDAARMVDGSLIDRARDLWPSGPRGLALILADHDELLRTLRRIYDFSSAGIAVIPTIRKEAGAALARYTDHGAPVRDRVLLEVVLEREAQDVKWGGPTHDATHSSADWNRYIREHEVRGEQALAGEPIREGDEWRRQMVRIAALAVAAIEAHDREVSA